MTVNSDYSASMTSIFNAKQRSVGGLEFCYHTFDLGIHLEDKVSSYTGDGTLNFSVQLRIET